MKDISVEFLTGHPVWTWVGLLGLLGLSIVLYWRTNPPLPKYLRVILGALRIVAILALMAALFEPVFSYNRHLERPRRLAILIDRSASMDREEQGLTRSSRVDSLLSGAAMSQLSRATEVATFFFGGNLVTRADEVQTDETALAAVLRELDQRQLSKPFDYWMLFTDGKSNSGPSPAAAAEGLPTPITPIGMAAGGDGVDVTIAETDYNAVVFVGQSTELKVKLHWAHADGQSLRVSLRDSGVLLAEARYVIDQEGGYADISLPYVPQTPGQRLLSVEVSPLSGEVNTENNSRSVSVKALRSRVSILLVTERPDYEVGFLNRFLRQSDRFEVSLVSLGNRSGNLTGRFPQAQAELNRHDLVILHDPDPARLTAFRSQLRSYLSERGGGLWVLLGERSATGPPVAWFNDLLPFYPSAPVQLIRAPYHGVPAEGQLFHPAIRLGDSREQIREIWAGLPPFKSLVPCNRTAPGSVILAFAGGTDDAADRMPILGYHRLGPGKVLASAAMPFWIWGFETLGYDDDNSAYSGFMDGCINWLTIQDDFDPIRILPEREVFSRGQPVRFEGFAFDQGFRPIPDVTGTVVLTHSSTGDTLETELLSRGEGKHAAEFNALPPGEYNYEASLSQEGELLKTSRGKLLVEAFSLEEYDQRGDPAALAALAQATGGSYFSYSDFTKAVSSLDLSPVSETISREIVIWGKLWLLVVFVAALALEWSLRKWHQLL